MSRVATVVPAESDLLCESCGYTLNGLADSGNCPECGQPIAQSAQGDGRSLSPFEKSPTVRGYVQTLLALLARPRSFYRNLYSRAQTAEARKFSQINLFIAAMLFSAAALGHALWTLGVAGMSSGRHAFILIPIGCALLTAPTYLLLFAIQRLAAWLSAVEAKYWGMRLPLQTVRRGLDFHSVNYLVVGVFANLVVWGYQLLLALGAVGYASATKYLYVLCGVVILSAGYLFQMYWIAMRNMMYANR